MTLYKEKIRRTKVPLELNLATTIKHILKCSYKCISNKRNTKENFHSLLDAGGNIVTKDEEKDEAFNGLLCLSLQ